MSSAPIDQSNYLDILSKLITFDTTSCHSNLQLIDFIQNYLQEFDIESTLIPNETGDKASLYATLGPKDRSGIGLSAHTDVVPVQGQSWQTDPFQLTLKDDGRVYGRGACDMKGFLACVLASVPDFLQSPLQTPIHLLFSYDEEVGCLGVRPMIDQFGNTLVRPKMVIVGEPSMMQVVTAHKGIYAFKTSITGFEAHSSVTHLGVNAIAIAAELITELGRIGRELQDAQNDNRFTPAFSSVHVGKISGGTALNIIPKSCEFIWEVRSIPGFDGMEVCDRLQAFAHEHLLPRMKAVHKDTDIVTVRSHDLPLFSTAPTSGGEELISLAMNWSGQNATHAVSYGTEAGLFEIGGCPTVICGPGNIEQAHKPNEFIAIDQLETCMRFLKNLGNYARNP